MKPEINAGWVLLIVIGGFVCLFSILFLLYYIFEQVPSEAYYCWDRFSHKERKRAISSYLAVVFTWASITATALGCALGFGIKGINDDIAREFDYKVYDIVSLERDSEVHGAFALGYGHVDEHPVYYFYIETDKGYKLKSIETEYTYIQENDEIEPSIYHYKKSGEEYSHYTIYCPTGTVVRDYKAW